ncbi:MAG: SGNH/GDSL hydrolase family protein [Rhodoferax sp.]|nr:SGNH/GDSL hydrolase family protein [Rhodoferax sp.]
MKHIKLTLSCLAAAALLTACGGDDGKIQFTQVVTFGDSISDTGTYQVGTIAQLGGGKFSVNGTATKVWSDALATSLGAPAQCAAQTGMLPNNGVTGAAVVNVAACNNYAQGSSRVTEVGSGPRGVALQKAFNEKNLGLMADSIQNQINRHLTKATTFGPNDLVTVNGGGNDFFMQLGAVGAAAGGGAAAAGTATVAGWPANTISIVSAGGGAAATAAAGAAVTAMGQAGAELASYVKTLIVAKGARYVVVRNLGDLNATPLGAAFDANTKFLSTALTTTFNAQLKQGLAGVAGVIYFDDYARGQAAIANPATSGYSNITSAACGPDAFSAQGETIGNSIICNVNTLIKGDTSKYLFADTVHPTPYAHQDAANYTVTLMRNAGWNF